MPRWALPLAMFPGSSVELALAARGFGLVPVAVTSGRGRRPREGIVS